MCIYQLSHSYTFLAIFADLLGEGRVGQCFGDRKVIGEASVDFESQVKLGCTLHPVCSLQCLGGSTVSVHCSSGSLEGSPVSVVRDV